ARCQRRPCPGPRPLPQQRPQLRQPFARGRARLYCCAPSGTQVALRRHDQCWRLSSEKELLFRVIGFRTGLQTEQHYVGRAGLVAAQDLRLTFDIVALCAQASGIDQLDRYAIRVEAANQVIARRAWLGADQRRRASESVEQAALARIGPTSQDHAKWPAPD